MWSRLLLVSLLAIMKAGHAYVPMDPTHPEQRLRQVVEIVRRRTAQLGMNGQSRL